VDDPAHRFRRQKLVGATSELYQGDIAQARPSSNYRRRKGDRTGWRPPRLTIRVEHFSRYPQARERSRGGTPAGAIAGKCLKNRDFSAREFGVRGTEQDDFRSRPRLLRSA
jgi:hypothetical protein